jgi:formate/nitrite transporter FocA (FNT family)
MNLPRSDSTSQPAMQQSGNTQDMLSGLSLEDAILHNAVKKIGNPIDKTYFLGLLAGVWVGFGGLAAVSIAGGIPEEVRNTWPLLPKLGVAFFFPFGECLYRWFVMLLTG